MISGFPRNLRPCNLTKNLIAESWFEIQKVQRQIFQLSSLIHVSSQLRYHVSFVCSWFELQMLRKVRAGN